MRYGSVAVGAMLGASLRCVLGNSLADRWGNAVGPLGVWLGARLARLMQQ